MTRFASAPMFLVVRNANKTQDIYQRSLALESSSGAGGVDFGKKKFPWFQK